MSIKVALVGASGNVGPAVLEQLLIAGFDVTVLTRQGSDHTFDPRAHVAKVDYESLDSIKNALTGQEVVVSTLNAGAVPLAIHLRIIDAAVAAGVKRFVPSEFGSNTVNPQTAKLPVFGDKINVQEHLKKASQDSGLSYSLLITGPFLDWGLKNGFILNLSGPVVPLYDGGERPFSSTTLSGVGKGVVGIINNLDFTKNTAVYIDEARVSQKELLRLSGKATDTEIVATADLEKEGFEELKKPSPNPAIIATRFIWRAIFGEGFGSLNDPQDVSNELFGLKPLSEEELRGLFSK
ncbi:unnamed protein product [Penicillium salamii]|uniref:NmrA-like domain-containing protein n=1 Tax=Penicillium salamii TaxID=1612424 RepID=A0A9W4J1V1_9EURO|nr:unnamed protein product [Penicillium salamii]CAG8314289.1 unnamed protein product [Penicillium salamii]CAG8341322.1 unnamed protein product [Penicillium salamii]CAG8364470.1 unnamed protein product [Penicillium salamii]CAG8374075.1 unnamed protein product [Penicillium salamii]